MIVPIEESFIFTDVNLLHTQLLLKPCSAPTLSPLTETPVVRKLLHIALNITLLRLLSWQAMILQYDAKKV